MPDLEMCREVHATLSFLEWLLLLDTTWPYWRNYASFYSLVYTEMLGGTRVERPWEAALAIINISRLYRMWCGRGWR